MSLGINNLDLRTKKGIIPNVEFIISSSFMLNCDLDYMNPAFLLSMISDKSGKIML